MTIALHPHQEAAFNAAGEALLDLKAAGHSLSLTVTDHGEGFRAWGYAHGLSGDAIWGRAETAAGAVVDCLSNIAKERKEGAKLKTAAEAIDKVKELVGDNPELVAKIDALPVKR